MAEEKVLHLDLFCLLRNTLLNNKTKAEKEFMLG